MLIVLSSSTPLSQEGNDFCHDPHLETNEKLPCEQLSVVVVIIVVAASSNSSSNNSSIDSSNSTSSNSN